MAFSSMHRPGESLGPLCVLPSGHVDPVGQGSRVQALGLGGIFEDKKGLPSRSSSRGSEAALQLWDRHKLCQNTPG